MTTLVEAHQSSPRIGLFIPCYNVAAEVSAVLDQIPAEVRLRLQEIIAVDNQSADQTRKVLQQAQMRWQGCPLTLVFSKGNYLLGGSTQIAFDWGLRKGWDFLICMHGDGQAAPADLVEFIRRIDSDPNLDFILGSRLLENSRVAHYSWSRRWGNHVFAFLQKRILRNSMKDIGSYVAFNLKTVQQLPYLRIPSDMGYQPNLILDSAQRLGRPLRFEEFPIYWGPVTSSSVNPWVYAVQHFARLMRYWLGRSPLKKDSFHYQIEVLPELRRPPGP